LWLPIAASIADSSKQIDPSISGSWYDSNNSGHGFLINIAGQPGNLTLVVTWYTYDNQRQPLWLLGAAPLPDDASSITLTLNSSRGALFGPDFISDDATLKPWGDLTLDFSSCDQGTALYQPYSDEFKSGSVAITRLTNTAGLECKPDQAPASTRKCSLIGPVTRVSDGDSITVANETGLQHKIRLKGIDTPELGQPYGTEAKDFMRSRVDQQQVCIEGTEFDRFNRLLGTVFLGNDNINLKIIQAGYAWHYKFFQDEQTPKNRQAYSDAEEQARLDNIGLWIEPDPIAPWDWRKGTR
jgi:endonuclease YncB( thermonuclease family)